MPFPFFSYITLYHFFCLFYIRHNSYRAINLTLEKKIKFNNVINLNDPTRILHLPMNLHNNNHLILEGKS